MVFLRALAVAGAVLRALAANRNAVFPHAAVDRNAVFPRVAAAASKSAVIDFNRCAVFGQVRARLFGHPNYYAVKKQASRAAF